MADGAGHAVDEGLGPDHQHVGSLAGLGRHVLAAADRGVRVPVIARVLTAPHRRRRKR